MTERVEFPVSARIKRPFGLRGSGTWTAAKNAAQGVRLVVSGNTVELDLGRLGNALAPALSLDATRTTMAVERLGWMGSPLFARPCVVLSGPSPRGPLQMAVSSTGWYASRQQRDFLRTLWAALLTAGVLPTGTESLP